MTDPIYAPPTANVVRTDLDSATATGRRYYVVAPTKFLLLAMLTGGLYLMYWFYRQWKTVRMHDASSIWPIPRGIFYIFFTHSLFVDIDRTLERNELDVKWRPHRLATWVVAATIASNLAGRLAGENVGSPLTDVLSIGLIPVLAYLMLPAQTAANAASGDADGRGNSRLTAANWVWMILGAAFWSVMLFGLYLIVTQPELFVEP